MPIESLNEIRVTEGLHLIKIRLSSAQEIFDLTQSNREHLRTWLPFIEETVSVSQTEGFIRSVLDQQCHKRDLVWEIRFYDRFAGIISFKEVDEINARTEIGYWIIKEFEGKGFVTQSCQKLIELAFNDLELYRIQIRVGIGNLRSAKIPERLGFKLEGIERAGEKHSDRYIDLMVFSLLRDEWEG